MDSGGNQDEYSLESSEQPDLESSKDDLAPGLLTLDKTLEPHYRAPPLLPIDLKKSLLPPIKSLNTLVKKSNYIIVSNKEAEPKKKIIGDIGEQNIITGKRIKKQLKAYIGFLANVIKN